MQPGFEHIGKVLVIAGLVIALIGVILLFGSKIPFLGRLPGDIIIKSKNITIYLPIITSIILSLIISLIIYLFRK